MLILFDMCVFNKKIILKLDLKYCIFLQKLVLLFSINYYYLLKFKINNFITLVFFFELKYLEIKNNPKNFNNIFLIKNLFFCVINIIVTLLKINLSQAMKIL